MGFNDQRYFFISGIISFSFFALILIAFGYTMITSEKIEQFALTQSQYVSISLDIATPEPMAEPLPEVSEVTPSPDKAPEPVPEKVPEISDLFSSVKPEKIQQKEDESVKRLEVLSALEQKMANRAQKTPQLADKVKNTSLAKPSIKIIANSGSTGPLVNEYHAKIQALIYSNYYPPSGSQGQTARIRINVNASGKLTAFRVLAYSGNSSFNSEVDWLKDRLRNVMFPLHPDGKDTVLEIILTAKE